jgi:hypothetical protein
VRISLDLAAGRRRGVQQPVELGFELLLDVVGQLQAAGGEQLDAVVRIRVVRRRHHRRRHRLAR